MIRHRTPYMPSRSRATMIRTSLAGVLLLAGCSGVTGPGLPVDWRTEPISGDALSRPVRLEAVGGVGSITVRGDTDLRGCHTLERSAVRLHHHLPIGAPPHG